MLVNIMLGVYPLRSTLYVLPSTFYSLCSTSYSLQSILYSLPSTLKVHLRSVFCQLLSPIYALHVIVIYAHVIACCYILGAIRLALTVWPPKYFKKLRNKN